MAGCKKYDLSECGLIKCPFGSTRITINNTCVCAKGKPTVYSGSPNVYGNYRVNKRNLNKICCKKGYSARFGKNPYCFGCLKNQPKVRCSRFGCSRLPNNSSTL